MLKTPFPQDADERFSQGDDSDNEEEERKSEKSSESSDESEDDDDELELLREYAKIKREREQE